MVRKSKFGLVSTLAIVFRRMLLVVPASILLLQYVGRMIDWNTALVDVELSSLLIEATNTKRFASQTVLTLPQLTQSASSPSCPSNFVLILNFDQLPALLDLHTNKIPRIVHQTSKSRCVTQKIANASKKWRFHGWSYIFHDDEAVMRLLLQDFSEFPHLEIVARNCLLHGTLKADLWRYLVLWVYGGVYADIDAVPAKFNAETIDATDDAFFVVEQFHLLSQWFMAVSPRHPLMYYAVQQSLSNLLKAPDTGSIPASMYTGPHALHAAYIQFRKDAGGVVDSATPGNKPVWAGEFTGSHNRTVTVVGVAANQNEYVDRDVLGNLKNREYQKMGMRHFQQDKKYASRSSCMTSMLDAHYKNVRDVPVLKSST